MSKYKILNPVNFSILPICILKASIHDGVRTELVHFNDIFKPNSKMMPKPVGEITDSAYAFTHYHYHEGIEILRINYGSADITVNNVSYRAAENDIVIINPFDAHSIYLNDAHSDFVRTCILFQPSLLFPIENDSSHKFFTNMRAIRFQNYIGASDPYNPALRACIDNMIELYNNAQDGWPIAVYSNLIIFYSNIIAGHLQSERPENPPYQFNFINTVSEFIENNYHSDITTADAAEFCRYTPEHFCRLFRKCFNKSFKDYLNIYRIQRAKDYIDRGNHLTVANLSARFGYNNQNHFSHMFKKHVGVLPSKYMSQDNK